ncbi:MAG: L-histidine N(alpha)-methyltransferase [Planctomycetota bacterium]
MVQPSTKYRLIDRTVEETNEFADAVTSGLSASHKTLPCRFLYDAAGSDLFEEICAVPEYYLTRTEREILAQHGESIVSGMKLSTT